MGPLRPIPLLPNLPGLQGPYIHMNMYIYNPILPGLLVGLHSTPKTLQASSCWHGQMCISLSALELA